MHKWGPLPNTCGPLPNICTLCSNRQIFIVKLYKKITVQGTGPHLLGNGSHVFIIHDWGYRVCLLWGRLGWGICLSWPIGLGNRPHVLGNGPHVLGNEKVECKI